MHTLHTHTHTHTHTNTQSGPTYKHQRSHACNYTLMHAHREREGESYRVT